MGSSNGWAYLEYTDVFDLLSRVAELQGSTPRLVAEIEIVAHGNPALCDDVSIGNATVVGESLRRIAGVTNATAIYLSGCNTGLELNGESVAQSFAHAFQAPVFGARGLPRRDACGAE